METRNAHDVSEQTIGKDLCLKGAGRAADLKINKSASLTLSHHIFSNIEPIYTK